MSIEDLYQNTRVPIPQELICMSDHDTLSTASTKLDELFDSLIEPFRSPIKNMLWQMYYFDEDVIVKPTLPNNDLANWVMLKKEDGLVNFKMILREDVAHTALIARISKIHELTHIAQAITRLDHVSMEQFTQENADNSFHLFTELSVAPTEKMLVDLIPEHLIAEDMEGLPPSSRLIIAGQLAKERALSYDQFTELEHRRTSCDASQKTPLREVHALHSRKDVYSFSLRMRSKQLEDQSTQAPQILIPS